MSKFEFFGLQPEEERAVPRLTENDQASTTHIELANGETFTLNTAEIKPDYSIPTMTIKRGEDVDSYEVVEIWFHDDLRNTIARVVVDGEVKYEQTTQ